MQVWIMRKNERWNIDTIDVTAKKETVEHNGKIYKLFRFVKRNCKKLIVAFVMLYVVIFAFGLLTTRIYVDENGERQAYRVTFSDLKKEDDYNELKNIIADVRDLLAEVTVVDIHLANGAYSNYKAASHYTSILDGQLDVMIPKITSLSVQDNQKPIKEAIESMLKNDLAIYLQSISEILTTGNTGAVTTALQYRENALNTYEIIIEEMEKISDSLHIEDSSFYKWELKNAAEKKDPTAILKSKEG